MAIILAYNHIPHYGSKLSGYTTNPVIPPKQLGPKVGSITGFDCSSDEEGLPYEAARYLRRGVVGLPEQCRPSALRRSPTILADCEDIALLSIS